MDLVYVLAIIVIIGLLYMLFEASWLEVSHINFSASPDGLKLLHISDVHVNFLSIKNYKIRNQVHKQNPDIILLSGDYIEKPANKKKFIMFLKEVCSGYPTYIVLGNHDYKAYNGNLSKLEEFKRSIESTGAKILHNNSVQYNKGSKTYNIVGIEDLSSNNTDVKKALSSCKKNVTTIAFFHNPDIVLDLTVEKVQYCLAGHFHGGQIWLPFNLEFRMLRHDKLCGMGYHRGRHKINGINVYLNRGIGNVCFPLRFMSRPEMAMVYFD